MKSWLALLWHRARHALRDERGDWLWGGDEIVIEAPPPPPPPPPMSEEERRLLALQEEIGRINLEIQREQQGQDQVLRAALERQFGGPLAEVIANQIFQQNRYQTELQGEQAAALAREKQMREIVARIAGMSPEELSARQMMEQIELGTLARATQKQVLEQAERERQAFIAATGLTPEESQAQEAQRQRVLSEGLFQRYQAGLAGTLPVSPGLERGLAEQRQTLEGSLAQRLGPGWRDSSIGIQALADFEQRAEELRESARRGAISEAEQFGFGLAPATERVRLSRGGALERAGLGGFEGWTDRLTGRPLIGPPITSPVGALFPFTQQRMLQTPPEFESVRGALAGERAAQFAPRWGGYQNAVNATNLLNQLRVGAAGAQAQATGGLVGALIRSGGLIGAAENPWWWRG